MRTSVATFALAVCTVVCTAVCTAGLAVGCATTRAPAAPKPVRHTDAPSTALQLFYDALSPYGEWWAHPTYGWVWTPDVSVGTWRPYVEGRWVATRAGLTFDSDAPWGWAVYHYGRWISAPWGWSWVPGSVWAPSWTSWRADDAHVGWAPLGPDGTDDGMPWTFVPRRALTASSIVDVALADDVAASLAGSAAPLAHPPRPRARLTPLVVMPRAGHSEGLVAAVKPPELVPTLDDLLGKAAALDPADEAPPPLRREVRGGRPPHPVARLEAPAPE